MELFPDGHHVRLRSRGRPGMYLAADDDGVGVRLSPRRASPHAAWQVHRVTRDGVDHVLLLGAAYGRYLAATADPAPRGHIGERVHQGAYNDDERDEEAVSWTPVGVPLRYQEVTLRHVTAASNRLLRANGKFCRWRTAVTLDDYFKHQDDMMRWVVEDVPPRSSTPPLPLPTPESRRGGGFWNTFICRAGAAVSVEEEEWLIHFAQAADDGSTDHGDWRLLRFPGRSVFDLRLALARELNRELNAESGIKLAVRAGNLGRLTHLVVDLPRNNKVPVHCIVLNTGTQADDELRDPDVDA